MLTRRIPVQRLRVIPPHQAAIPLEEQIKILPDNQTFQYRQALRLMFKRPIQEIIVRETSCLHLASMVDCKFLISDDKNSNKSQVNSSPMRQTSVSDTGGNNSGQNTPQHPGGDPFATNSPSQCQGPGSNNPVNNVRVWSVFRTRNVF